ncbi:MAG: hypothetical protein JWM39_310 [Parcubacteria group bacterium]|nr:hypothetical protein [Parcubacteria group bacterium]
MITSSIYTVPIVPLQRLGFSVWARGAPKPYLATYPQAAKSLIGENAITEVKVVGLVDDIWPLILYSRTDEEQSQISQEYLTNLPQLQFDEVYLVSTFVDVSEYWEYLQYSLKFSTSQFLKLLPKSKGTIDDLRSSEIIGFLWHLHVIRVAMEKFGLNGFLAGIRSEYFYLAARQALPPFSVFFLSTT